ncbi:DUF1127 domain-containing protein [Ruegeria arenilitoris]|uniref:DUF1127 domain-containing protein n=1 Tax=Ruegeria arenilitoris TaxID=1173585 RepID=UPI003463BA02
MAHSTSHRSAAMNLLAVVGDIFNGIYEALISVGEANAKVLRIKALHELTDEELAARGIQREDIVRLVMADVY